MGIDFLAGPMTYLFNQCVDINVFPNIWKIFKVIGLYKCKESREDKKNYHPISLLNPLLKLVEKEMLYQMKEHMKKNIWNKQSYIMRIENTTLQPML